MSSNTDGISLSSHKAIQRLLIQLFSLFEVPFDGHELNLRSLKQLFESAQMLVSGVSVIDSGDAKVAEAARQLLIVTDKGIIRHQIRLMAQYFKFTPVSATFASEITKVVENGNVVMAVVDVAVEINNASSLQVESPNSIALLKEFSRHQETPIAVIALMEPRDKRVKQLELTGTKVVVKDTGWQQALMALLKESAPK